MSTPEELSISELLREYVEGPDAAAPSAQRIPPPPVVSMPVPPPPMAYPQPDFGKASPPPYPGPYPVPLHPLTSTPEQLAFERDVREVLHELGNLLIEKNRKYGDAALNPKRIFSRADTTEQIKTRIDDKLSRVANAQTDDTEDPEWDLMGYFVLLRIAKRRLAALAAPAFGH